jgi:hypothetical protein
MRRRLHLLRYDEELIDESNDDAGDGLRPVGPGPPGELSEDGGEQRTDDEARGCGGSEQSEDERLARAVGIHSRQQRDAVGQHGGRADALQRAEDGEVDQTARIGSKAQQQAAQPEPEEAQHEHALVAVHIAQSAGDENEGADGEAEGGDEPRQLRVS